MVRFHLALTLLLATTIGSVDAFHQQNPLAVSSSSRQQCLSQPQPVVENVKISSPFSSRGVTTTTAYSSPKRRSTMVRPVSASASSPSPSELGDQSSSNSNNHHLNSLTNAAVDFVVGLDQPDLDAAEIERRQKLLQNRNDQKTYYKVTLPLASKSTTSVMPSSAVLQLGITLCQISPGRQVDSDVRLNLDTLELEYTKTSIGGYSSSNSEEKRKWANIQRRIDGEFHGLVVASVEEGSAGWVAGVRPGDIMKTTSATIGSQLWPKSTLEGVKSALMSRKAVSQSVQFEFQRLEELVDNQFELTLARPIGLQMKGTQEKEFLIVFWSSCLCVINCTHFDCPLLVLQTRSMDMLRLQASRRKPLIWSDMLSRLETEY
jgi:hypothetical protein